jgi:predicted DCC family thiol-disulfide oxidoreductase YuxK
LNHFTAYSYRHDPGVPAFPDDKPLIVLDGHCALCAASAQFVIAHDHDRLIRMTPAQSALGAALFRHFGLKSGDYDTVLLIEYGLLRVRSDAALRIAEIMSVYHPWVWLARRCPRVLADAVYSLVARNRIRIWGARETCLAPQAEHQDRFL